MAPPRSAWMLDPDSTFLNHGSFGACPRAVLERQALLRSMMERDPGRFLVQDLPGLLTESRAKLAAFVGAAPQNLVFVDNATTGVNTVLASIPLAEGDEVLTTDHGYRACTNAVSVWAARRGARLVVASLPFPVADEAQVLAALVDACTARTRLAVIDHVTSPTGLVLPVARLISELHSRGVQVLIDGAHAPGMLPLELDALGADYYTGNAHKWLCAPKGSAFLFVLPERQRTIRPLVISHAASMAPADPARFQAEFDWVGTNDPTPWIAVGDAIGYGDSIPEGGWPTRMQRNRRLALEARKLLCDALGVAEPCPASMIGSLASIPLPPAIRPSPSHAAPVDPLQQHLRSAFRIDVPVIGWPDPDHRLVRVSAQLYNELADYELLARALLALSGKAGASR